MSPGGSPSGSWRLISENPGLGPEWEQLEAIKAKGWPIVLIDLRVENRTLVDLPGFCAKLIEFLLEETGGVAVVLCGHTGSYASHVDATAARPPFEVQKEIVAELARGFSGRRLELIDTIAAGMRRTVFWSHHAHFFVAPWGASLVTYRWVARKPGLIMSNTSNLRSNRGRPQADIYSSPAFMGDPGDVYYLRAEDVEDDPNAPTLSRYIHVEQPLESFYNFRVNENAVFDEVRKLLAKFGPRQR